MKRKRGETIQTKKFDNREKRKEKENKKKDKIEKTRSRAEFAKRKCTGNGVGESHLKLIFSTFIRKLIVNLLHSFFNYLFFSGLLGIK